MRTLRLGRTFDAVFVHDAVMYLTTEPTWSGDRDRGRVHRVRAAYADPSRRDARVLRSGTDHGGHDGRTVAASATSSGRTTPIPTHTTDEVDYVVILREPGRPPRVEHDHHTVGIFPESTWRDLIAGAELEIVDPGVVDPNEDEHEVFVARRPA